MKIPEPFLQYLKANRIVTPTPIQLQGIPTGSVSIPVAFLLNSHVFRRFSGRDMIGIAFTGSGKTLAFCLPLIMTALEEETKVPFIRGEGPIGVVLCPSRELATQTYENLLNWCGAMAKSGKYPQLNTLLCIGGISMNDQSHVLSKGVHIVVATPGRLIDMLEKKKFTFNNCKFLCMDEADRMIDLGFEDDVRNIMSFFKVHTPSLLARLSLTYVSLWQRQRQTLLFSATMPKKIQDFAQQSLVHPVLVNVGRAGAANLDVLQVVEYVKQEAKMVYLLECLQKTAPPVIIFSENKNEVDDIQEYLLLKGVEAVAIHGSKSNDRVPYTVGRTQGFPNSPRRASVRYQVLQIRR
jgi:ATP-dependent RNA helicase DDX41